jgi:hypothetical protein
LGKWFRNFFFFITTQFITFFFDFPKFFEDFLVFTMASSSDNKFEGVLSTETEREAFISSLEDDKDLISPNSPSSPIHVTGEVKGSWDWTSDSLQKLKRKDLKDLLQSLNLSTIGKKTELILRFGKAKAEKLGLNEEDCIIIKV